MSTLTLFNNRKWNPFQEMDALNGHLNHLLYGDRACSASRDAEGATWTPLVDITENNESFFIRAELPAVDKKDITLTVEDGVLTLAGERKSVEVKDDEKVHRVERSYGKFVRTFRVPKNLDTAKVSAEFKDGVLSVQLPKPVEAQPKSIDIAVA